MELRHLVSFRAVADERNFSRAAEKLHISQPPLSRQISELEEELGVILFNRGPHGVSLTPAGRYLEQEASKILDRIGIVKDRISKIEAGESRLLRIGYVASAMYSFLPELIGSFRRAFPDLSFEFIELATDEQAKAILSGKVDLGFVRSWIREEGVRFVSVAEETLSVIHSPDMVIPGDGEGLSCFRHSPFIAFSKTCAPGIAEYANQLCAKAGFVPDIIFTAGQFDSVLRLVFAGYGWSIVPTLALTNASYGIESKILTDLPEKILIGAAIREEETDPVISSLLDITVRFFM